MQTTFGSDAFIHFLPNKRFNLSLPLICVCLTSTLLADTNELSQIEKSTPHNALGSIEIIAVSAKRPGISPFMVADSIEHFSKDDLLNNGFNGSQDIAKAMANVNLRMSNPMNAAISIRGVGAENWHINANQGVLQVIDGAPIQGNYASRLGFFDIQSVQVYRGPQNGLLGINSTGGALQINSVLPSFEGITGQALLRHGRNGLTHAEAAINGVISSNIAVRVAGFVKSRDPLWFNYTTDRFMGSEDNRGLRAHTLWQPSDAQSLLVTYQYGKDAPSRQPYLSIGFWDENGANVQNGRIVDINAPVDCPQLLNFNSRNYNQPNNCVTLQPFSDGLAVKAGRSDWYETYDAAQDISQVSFNTLKAKYQFKFDLLEFTSVSVMDEIESDYLETLNNIPSGQAFMPSQALEKVHYSQEFRLVNSSNNTPLDWMVGVYYSQSDDYFGTVITRTDEAGAPFGIVPSVAIEQDTRIKSVFALLDYDVDEKNNVTADLRYTKNKKTGTSTARLLAKTDDATPTGVPLEQGLYITRDLLEALSANPAGPCPPSVGGFPCEQSTPVEQTNELVGGSLRWSYFVYPQHHVYAKYSRGFLAGAFDTRALAAFAGNADKPVEPEVLDAAEIGYKHMSNDQSANIALFYYLWKDKQTFDTDEDGLPAFVNIPEAKLLGADLSWQRFFSNNWEVRANLGLLKSEITDIGTLQFTPLGSELSHTPHWSYSLSVAYRVNWLAGESVFFLTHARRDEVYDNAKNEAQFLIESQGEWGVSWRHEFLYKQHHIYVDARIDNLSGEKQCASLTDGSNLAYTIQCRPNLGQAIWSLGMGIQF